LRSKPNRDEILNLIKARKSEYEWFLEEFDEDDLEKHEPKDVRRLMISQVVNELERILEIIDESETVCPICDQEFDKPKQLTGHMVAHSREEKSKSKTKLQEEIESL